MRSTHLRLLVLGIATPGLCAQTVLWDNGPFVTHPGAGAGGADASAVHNVAPMNHNLFGFSAQVLNNNAVADDFAVSAGTMWTVSELDLFAYQTGSTTTSTITAAHFQIWNGHPTGGGTVIAGNIATPRTPMLNTWSNCYRTLISDLSPTNRPVMRVRVQLSPAVVLPPGTYWLEYQLDGSLASGPFVPPVTIIGVRDTGNGIQRAQTIWTPLNQAATPNPPAGAGLPFVLRGTVAGTPVPASAVTVGAGCPPQERVSFHEAFGPSNPFDLGGRRLTMTRIPAGGYSVSNSAATTIVRPAVAGLALTDNSLSAVLPLGFTFRYPQGPPGGVTNIRVCDNGFVHLDSTATSADPTPTIPELLSGGPRLFGFWSDLLPDGPTNNNNVYFESVPGVSATITWWDVATTSGTARFQIKLFANDDVHFNYQSVTDGPIIVIAGGSPGGGNPPGPRDLSTPFISASADKVPLEHMTLDQSRVGTTLGSLTTAIPPDSFFQALMVGLPITPALDLTFLGARSCFLQTQSIVMLPFVATGSTGTVYMPIPNQIWLLGAQLMLQSVVIAPSVNAAGLGTSNGTLITLGNV